MNILFYSPFNRRSRDVETVMLQFKAEGHTVISLTQSHGIDINPFLMSQGIEAVSYPVSGKKNLLHQFRHFLYFISFCRKKKIDLVFSHLDSANFIASLAQYFVTAKVYLCRHHIDEASLYQYDRSLTYRITNAFAKKIIVVSREAMDYMISNENVASRKLMHINLAYDFSLYSEPDKVNVEKIRQEYGEGLLCVAVCRLTEYKRPALAIDTVKLLKNKKIPCKLIILGEGHLKDVLQQDISNCGLQNEVILLGHVPNVIDYLDAADFLLHPSVLESSCVAVKEAGLVKKPVIVCDRIGDFNEYIQHGINGFLVDKDKFSESATQIIEEHYKNPGYLAKIGQNLFSTITERFSVKSIFQHYRKLLDQV